MNCQDIKNKDVYLMIAFTSMHKYPSWSQSALIWVTSDKKFLGDTIYYLMIYLLISAKEFSACFVNEWFSFC